MSRQIAYLDGEDPRVQGLIFSSDFRLIPAGRKLQPHFAGCEILAQERILVEQYDFHLNFPSNLPRFSFYPVPQLSIFAIDSHNGLFAASSAYHKDPGARIYYLDAAQKLHYLAASLHELYSLLVYQPDWKRQLGLPIPPPQPEEKAAAFLIRAFSLIPCQLPQGPAPETILLFPNLAAAKQALPFVEISDSPAPL